jgi:hypothetical protein
VLPKGGAPVSQSEIEQIRVNQQFYRGYRIGLFGEGSSWSFKLSPLRIDLPAPGRSIFFKVANTEPRALSLAKIEIDWLFTRQNTVPKKSN